MQILIKLILGFHKQYNYELIEGQIIFSYNQHFFETIYLTTSRTKCNNVFQIYSDEWYNIQEEIWYLTSWREIRMSEASKEIEAKYK